MSVATTTIPVIQQSISIQVKATRRVFRLLGHVSPDLATRFAIRLFLTPNQRPYSGKAQRILSDARLVSYEHGSRTLQGYIWGGENEPTILLAHGWEANAGSMRAFVPPLVELGYRVIAFDAPAHGRSTGRRTTIYDYSGALQSISEAFGPIDGIIAHSLGAAATLLMVGREAQLGIKKVVVLGSPSNIFSVIQSWGTFLHIPHPVVAKMRQRLIDRIGLPLDDRTLERSVANITLPGLIIHDENDSLIPYANALAIHKQWRNASLTATQGLGHLGILYDPETVQRAVAFVAAR
ncbi:MAG: alpha/beta hydrolase [Chloroflexota bacterium]